MRKETKAFRLPVAVEHKARVLAGHAPIGPTIEVALDVLMAIWCELHDDSEPVAGVDGAAMKLLDSLRERWGCDEDTVPKVWLENENAYRVEQARAFDNLLKSFEDSVAVGRGALAGLLSGDGEESDE